MIKKREGPREEREGAQEVREGAQEEKRREKVWRADWRERERE
jgi:hypothetical protein